MSRLVLATLFAATLVADSPLQTEYKADTAYTVTIDSTFEFETTSFSMERDGVPVEGGRGGGGEASSTQTRQIIMTDTVLEVAAGQPTRVQREFDTLTSNSVRSRGGEEMESDLDCPLQGVTLELTSEDGEVSVELIDGTAPDDDAILEGHKLALALDALYPEEATPAGEAYVISGEKLLRAMALDQEAALFPIPAREEGAERGGRGGGRGGAESAARYFAAASWDLEGMLEETKEEHDGVEYYAVKIKGEAEGSLPERERGGRDREDRSLAAPTVSAPAFENSFSIELEGTLLVSVAGKHPAHFELEASLTTTSTREMQRRESSMTIHSENAGTLEYAVTIEPVTEESESSGE